MPHVEIVLTAEGADPAYALEKVCVVIDVLRATTTMVTALDRGCRGIIPVETPSEARAVARERKCLLGGERNGVRIEGFDLGNSPLEYMPEKVRGQEIAFTTTNGTRAIRACSTSKLLLVASFLNGRAVSELLAHQTDDILIVCAGTRGKPSIEDTVCGGMLLEALLHEETPAAEEAISQWDRHKADLAGMMKNTSAHGRDLVALGFEADIDFAARLNILDIVAVLEADSVVRKSP